mmetsp:Transcript_81561/g.253493  ORF Transcript_81561/g.253493 Transcript_81561/m.253493 type:complete len:233 (-) Transcript_81561:204-902(-)
MQRQASLVRSKHQQALTQFAECQLPRVSSDLGTPAETGADPEAEAHARAAEPPSRPAGVLHLQGVVIQRRLRAQPLAGSLTLVRPGAQRLRRRCLVCAAALGGCSGCLELGDGLLVGVGGRKGRCLRGVVYGVHGKLGGRWVFQEAALVAPTMEHRTPRTFHGRHTVRSWVRHRGVAADLAATGTASVVAEDRLLGRAEGEDGIGPPDRCDLPTARLQVLVLVGLAACPPEL